MRLTYENVKQGRLTVILLFEVDAFCAQAFERFVHKVLIGFGAL